MAAVADFVTHGLPQLASRLGIKSAAHGQFDIRFPQATVDRDIHSGEGRQVEGRSGERGSVANLSVSVEKAINGLFPLGRPMEKPRFPMVGDRRIVRRQTFFKVC
jgi:hypothetical protein